MENTGIEEYSHFFEVKLDLFDGPIDLLLHLVKQNELPIEKVSLAEVTHQYLACIERMRQFDLEVAGEYLVIAATLLSIKSSVLLNEPVELVVDSEGNLVDPHEELLKKLRAAEVYRESARHLGTRSQLGIDVFNSPSSLKDIEPPPVKYVEHDPILLGKAFRKLLAQADSQQALMMTISVDTVTIVERMMGIIQTLKSSGGKADFRKLIPDVTDRSSIISCFVALLELCKRSVISVQQDDVFDEIYIVLGLEGDTSELSSEFDEKPAEADASANG